MSKSKSLKENRRKVREQFGSDAVNAKPYYMPWRNWLRILQDAASVEETVADSMKEKFGNLSSSATDAEDEERWREDRSKPTTERKPENTRKKSLEEILVATAPFVGAGTAILLVLVCFGIVFSVKSWSSVQDLRAFKLCLLCFLLTCFVSTVCYSAAFPFQKKCPLKNCWDPSEALRTVDGFVFGLLNSLFAGVVPLWGLILIASGGFFFSKAEFPAFSVAGQEESIFTVMKSLLVHTYWWWSLGFPAVISYLLAKPYDDDSNLYGVGDTLHGELVKNTRTISERLKSGAISGIRLSLVIVFLAVIVMGTLFAIPNTRALLLEHLSLVVLSTVYTIIQTIVGSFALSVGFEFKRSYLLHPRDKTRPTDLDLYLGESVACTGLSLLLAIVVLLLCVPTHCNPFWLVPIAVILCYARGRYCEGFRIAHWEHLSEEERLKYERRFLASTSSSSSSSSYSGSNPTPSVAMAGISSPPGCPLCGGQSGCSFSCTYRSNIP